MTICDGGFMAIRLDNRFIFLMYCVVHEAARSVHYSMMIPDRWKDFLEYFDSEKRNRLIQIQQTLLTNNGQYREDIGASFPYRFNLLRFLMDWIECRYLCTHNSPVVSSKQIDFLFTAITMFLDVLNEESSQDTEIMKKLRDFLIGSEVILENRLRDRKLVMIAKTVDHFPPSTKFRSPSISELQEEFLRISLQDK